MQWIEDRGQGFAFQFWANLWAPQLLRCLNFCFRQYLVLQDKGTEHFPFLQRILRLQWEEVRMGPEVKAWSGSKWNPSSRSDISLQKWPEHEFPTLTTLVFSSVPELPLSRSRDVECWDRVHVSESLRTSPRTLCRWNENKTPRITSFL